MVPLNRICDANEVLMVRWENERRAREAAEDEARRKAGNR